MDIDDTERLVREGRMTPGQARTARATAARRRGRLERLATELREHDYIIIPPETVGTEMVDIVSREMIRRGMCMPPELFGVGGHTLVRGVS